MAAQEAAIYADGEINAPDLPPDEPELQEPAIPPEPGNTGLQQTRSGRTVVPRVRLIETSASGIDNHDRLSDPEKN